MQLEQRSFLESRQGFASHYWESRRYLAPTSHFIVA
jgi:hypothetical protein